MSNRIGRSLYFAIVVLALCCGSSAQLAVSVSFGPPALPIYVQPPCPAEGYLWAPGYWAYDYDDADYYWVPGTWVMAPEVGFLWTPGWWGWGGGGYLFHEGYWGPQVGFYGGINYGFGYFGDGYQGGRWDHDRFFYNRAVNNVNVTNIHNVYNTTVVNRSENHVSYNGGNGGITARPTPQQETAARERHVAPVAAQTQQMQAARTDRQQRASVNQGKPPVAATPRPGAMQERGVVAANQAGGVYHPPAPAPAAANREPANRTAAQPAVNQQQPAQEERARQQQANQQQAAKPPQANAPVAPSENNAPRPSTAVHPSDLPPHERPPAPNTGSAETDKQFQQQQEQLRAQQDQEHQKLQQQQDQEHQRAAQQQANNAQKQQQEQQHQQMEQQHQQQTQQLEQQHQQQQQQLARQQQQQMQSRQQQPHPSQEKPPKN
jgi:WXXGXW repeat (2 copies)